MANFKYVSEFYTKNYGMPKHQADALAAHAMRESQGDPTAVGDGGKAKGVFQWHPDRYGKLVEYAKENDAKPTDLDTQLRFAHHEFTKGQEQHAGGKLVNAPDVEAANIAMLHYLRPAGYTYNKPEGANEYTARLALAKGGRANMDDVNAWGGGGSPYNVAPNLAPDDPLMKGPQGMNINQEIQSWQDDYGPGLLSRMGDRFMTNLDDPKKMAALRQNSLGNMQGGAGLMAAGAPGKAAALPPPPQAHIPPPTQGPPIQMLGVGAPMGGQTAMGAPGGMSMAPQTMLTPAQQMLMKMGFNGMGGGMR